MAEIIPFPARSRVSFLRFIPIQLGNDEWEWRIEWDCGNGRYLYFSPRLTKFHDVRKPVSMTELKRAALVYRNGVRARLRVEREAERARRRTEREARRAARVLKGAGPRTKYSLRDARGRFCRA